MATSIKGTATEEVKIVDLTMGNPFVFGEVYKKWWPLHTSSAGNSMTTLEEERTYDGYQVHGIRTPESFIEQIKQMHSLSHNYFPTSTEIPIFGMGSTQVMRAIFYSLFKKYGPLQVVQKAPAYSLHKDIVEGLRLPNTTYQTFDFLTSLVSDDDRKLVEIVTSPNNPTGENRHPETNANVILFDFSHNWPCYSVNVDENLKMMEKCRSVKEKKEIYPLFSMSKSIGHPSDRVGYLWIEPEGEENKMFIDTMKGFVYNDTLGISTAGQMRCAKRLTMLLDEKMKPLDEVKNILIKRFDLFDQLFKKEVPSLTINSPRGGPYLWLSYNADDASDDHRHCSEKFMKDWGIMVISGLKFDAKESCARLNLMSTSDNLSRAYNAISTSKKLSPLDLN